MANIKNVLTTVPSWLVQQVGKISGLLPGLLASIGNALNPIPIVKGAERVLSTTGLAKTTNQILPTTNIKDLGWSTKSTPTQTTFLGLPIGLPITKTTNQILPTTNIKDLGWSTKSTPTQTTTGISTKLTSTETTKPPERITPTQVPQTTEKAPAGPQIITSSIPGQVSPTPVAQRLTSTPPETPAAPTRISPPTPTGAPTPTGISTGLTPPTGTETIPSPVVPSSIIQREAVRQPMSEIVRQLMEAQMRTGERPATVEVPMPEPLEARAKPRTLEELLAELLIGGRA